jgi:hypothetical protein
VRLSLQIEQDLPTYWAVDIPSLIQFGRYFTTQLIYSSGLTRSAVIDAPSLVRDLLPSFFSIFTWFNEFVLFHPQRTGMKYLIVAFACLSFLLSSTAASLSRPKDPLAHGESVLAPGLPRPVPKPLLVNYTRPESEFQITSETEVTLNGKKCQYRDVPSGATIVEMDVGADRKTILRIHFRTKR